MCNGEISVKTQRITLRSVQFALTDLINCLVILLIL